LIAGLLSPDVIVVCLSAVDNIGPLAWQTNAWAALCLTNKNNAGSL
jgi:hypothetical protein